MKIRLLLVEDNLPDQQVWTQALEKHDAVADGNSALTFDLTIASTLEEAKLKIEDQVFDAAVVDLRLATATHNGMDSSGNEVINLLLKTEMAAVAAFTGEPGAVEVPTHAKSLVRVFTKGGDEGEGVDAVLEWLLQQTPMNVAIKKAKAIIDGELANFFVRSIWPRWNNWLAADAPDDQDFLATAVARHLTSHVYAALLDKHKQKAHPEEWFMVPPIHAGIRTGDIIRHPTGQLEIVVTPRCDLATRKRKKFQLANCTDVTADWATLLEKRLEISEQVKKLQENAERVPSAMHTKLATAVNKVHSFTQHRNISSLHFLPQMKLLDGSTVGPLMINFDEIRSAGVTEDQENLILSMRIASLSSEFIPSMVERLGTFFSRIGTPDYSELINE